MKTMSYTESRARYAEVLDSVIDNREEVVITRAGHEPVVIVSLADFESLRETAYLMRSPANARRLLDAMERLVADAKQSGARVVAGGERVGNRGYFYPLTVLANVPDDAVYPTAFVDSEGRPFSSGDRYVIHFAKDQIPPVQGFWSLTMYDEHQLFTANPINRYAIGDRDKLAFNPDGSLDLYIQSESPGKDKEANWLPAPKSGSFTMNLRLYWPKTEVLDATWSPPPVKRVD